MAQLFASHIEMEFGSIIPYGSVFIDASITDFLRAFARCLVLRNSNARFRLELTEKLGLLFSNPSNANHVLPCLCVRTGFDLFLRAKKFPAGSEIIMSAINIPDMSKIAELHDLIVVSADINPQTLSVDPSVFERLITESSVAIVVSHIYGKWCDVSSLIDVAKKHGLYFIEDCAECFCGFEHLGHSQSDLSLFSFGVIKSNTCFSGALVKIRDDGLYTEMQKLQASYDIQGHGEFAFKLLKYLLCFFCINGTYVTKIGMAASRFFNVDHQKYTVQLLRSFPKSIMERIRKQPSVALLATIVHRLQNFDPKGYRTGQEKMKYVIERLPEGMKCIGMASFINNYWLFPVIVEHPDSTTHILRKLGIDAYKGCTQLGVIYSTSHEESVESDNRIVNVTDHGPPLSNIPVQAKYVIDHAIYLPVHKLVPYKDLDKMCLIFHLTMAVHKLKHNRKRTISLSKL